MNDLPEVVKTLNELANTLIEKSLWTDGEALSRALVKLAAYNIFMADFVAQAHLQEAQDKDLVSFETAKYIKDLTGGAEPLAVNKAEVEAKADTRIKTLYEVWRGSEHQYMMLNLKRMSVNSLIEAIRTRVATLRQERELS